MVTAQSSPPTSTLYEEDFDLWIAATVESLKAGKLLEVDYENLIKELESMGRNNKNAIKSNLKILLMHLLKYKFQPEKRNNSWRYTIVEHRDRIITALETSPSLRSYLEENLQQSYATACRFASEETGLSMKQFPDVCPFSTVEILDLDFLPES